MLDCKTLGVEMLLLIMGPCDAARVSAATQRTVTANLSLKLSRVLEEMKLFEHKPTS